MRRTFLLAGIAVGIIVAGVVLWWPQPPVTTAVGERPAIVTLYSGGNKVRVWINTTDREFLPFGGLAFTAPGMARGTQVRIFGTFSVEFD